MVQRQNGRAILPINGWLERQRLYTGDASTLSWKRHVEWYNARQSEAVIWLMRRANRAFAKVATLCLYSPVSSAPSTPLLSSLAAR